MTPILTIEQRLNLGSVPESGFDSGYHLTQAEFVRRYESRQLNHGLAAAEHSAFVTELMKKAGAKK